MAYRYHIDADVNCVFIVHVGTFDLEDIVEQYREIIADPDHRPGMNFLRDSRTCAISAAWTLDRMMGVSRTRLIPFLGSLGECKIAWVVQSAADFGRVNQGRLVMSDDYPNLDRRPFTDIAQALKWLGIPRDYKIPGG